MVGREGEVFSNRMLHYATSLHGTRQYWFKQRSRLIAMVDTIGLPTIFFTHSAADLQWPELACLICPDDPDSSSSRSKALRRTQRLPTGSSIIESRSWELLGTTSSISSCTKIVNLPNILASATSLSTRRCAGGYCRQVVSMFASTCVMPNAQSRSSETWSVMKGKFSLITCCTMLPLCMEPGQAVLIQAAQPPHCHGRHNWSAHHLLHTQCNRPPVARACMPHLPR